MAASDKTKWDINSMERPDAGSADVGCAEFPVYKTVAVS